MIRNTTHTLEQTCDNKFLSFKLDVVKFDDKLVVYETDNTIRIITRNIQNIPPYSSDVQFLVITN